MNKNLIVTNRIIFTLSVIGFLISAYLFYTYIFGEPIVCLDRGCEAVRASKYSYFLGLPIPAFGGLFYFGVFILSFIRTIFDDRREELINRLIFGFSAVGLLISLYLTYLEAFVIKAFCTWCVSSALVVLVMFLTSLYELRRKNETKE